MLAHRWLWVIAAAIAVLGLGSTYTAVAQLWHYYLMTARVPAHDVTWSVVARDSDHYLLQADYTYRVANALYQGTTVLPAPVYRNSWAAEQDIPLEQAKRWSVWYVAHKPAVASLEHTFPLKETLYSGMIWVLVVYFIGLGFYLSRQA